MRLFSLLLLSPALLCCLVSGCLTSANLPSTSSSDAGIKPDVSEESIDASETISCDGLNEGCPTGYSCRFLCGNSSKHCLLDSQYDADGCVDGRVCATTCQGTTSCFPVGFLTADGCSVENIAGVLQPISCQNTCSSGKGCYAPNELTADGCPQGLACQVGCYTVVVDPDGGAMAAASPVACYLPQTAGTHCD